MCGSATGNHQVLGKRLNKSQGKSPSGKIGITTTICKCDVCGLIYSNPLPIPVDLQDHYGVPPEEYWKNEYFNINEHYFKFEIERLQKLTPFEQGQKTLDIGAGLGKQMIALANAGYETYGFEPSKPFYEKAVSKMNMDPERFKLGAIEEVEYPDAFFDFISFGAVLEHLYDPSASIITAMQWLKPNGIIHIEVPSSEWLINKFINLFYKLRLTDYVGNISPMHKPFHLYEFSLNSFERHAAINNYTIAHHEYFVCETFMPSYLDFILMPYMNKTNTGMQLTVWLRKK
jgi:2-polyprenyl-3-methyl-5-hydroxy-6-metoxy-1,4-benzoquinol methylase